MRNLIAYAKAASEDGQTQPATPQKSLEERAFARPVTTLTVDQAVKRALDSNIELNVERLNPTVQELAWRQIRAAYTPTLGSTLNANSNNPLPTSLLNGGTNVTNADGQLQRQPDSGPAVERREFHRGVQQPSGPTRRVRSRP